MFTKKYKIAVPILVILTMIAVIAAHSIFSPSESKAFAYITLEVNPNFTLTVDSNEKVVAVDLTNAEAKQVFAKHSLIGKNISDALKIIADRLDDSGFLNDDDKILFIVQPAEGVKKEAVTGVSERVLVTLKTELETRKAQPTVEIVVLDKTTQTSVQTAQILPIQDDDDTKINSLANSGTVNIDDPTSWTRIIRNAHKDLLSAGFTEAEALDVLRKASLANPISRETYEIASGFVDMKDVGIPYALSKSIFDLGQGLDENVFRREISTLISDLIDMHEAGISSETGIKALVAAIAADRSLREVSTIVSGIIDLKESGVPETDLIARANRAIEADPTLRNFDDLLGIRDIDDDRYDDRDDYKDDDRNNDDYDDYDDDDYDDNDDNDDYDDNGDDDNYDDGDDNDENDDNDDSDDDNSGNSDDKNDDDR